MLSLLSLLTNTLPSHSASEVTTLYKPVYYYYFFFDPDTQFPRNEKLRYAI